MTKKKNKSKKKVVKKQIKTKKKTLNKKINKDESIKKASIDVKKPIEGINDLKNEKPNDDNDKTGWWS